MGKTRNALIGMISLVVLVMTVVQASWTQAGPADTPLPSWSAGGGAVYHVYTAVGVIKNNNLETGFVCTNLDTIPVNIGVEVFDHTGVVKNSFPNGEFLGVAVGETVTVGTSGTAVLHEDKTISGLASLRNGSGRVVASSKKISCTAMLLDELHAIKDPAVSSEPPPTVVNLPLIPVQQ